MNPLFPSFNHIHVYCIEFNVNSIKSVVFQNMIVAVLLWNRLSPLDLFLYKSV